MADKQITLTEKDQRDLFCMAWHLTNLIEDCKEKKIASFSTPCETCKYQKGCWENEHFDFYGHAETLTKITGVKFLPVIGARELARKGKLNFIESNDN